MARVKHPPIIPNCPLRFNPPLVHENELQDRFPPAVAPTEESKQKLIEKKVLFKSIS
jgi:hypothetical protein